MVGLLGAGRKAAADAAAPTSQGLLAYHGSPHSFDRFSMDAIGTGEGAQAYGHGLYFAEREATAQSYRDYLKGNKLILNDGTEITYSNHLTNIEKAIKAKFPKLSPDNVRRTAKSVVDDNLVPGDVEGMGVFDSTGYRAENIYMTGIRANKKARESKGSMYEVNIDATTDDLLDFDAPLKEQSEKIQKIFPPDNYPETFTGRSLYDRISGSAAIGGDSRRFRADGSRESAPQASAHLNSLGIKGIKYADAQTRFSPGKKTSNYVIFDDRLINISRQYGIPITVLSGLVLAPEDAEAGILTASLSPVLRESLDKYLRDEPLDKRNRNQVEKYLAQIATDRTAFGRRERMRMTPGATPDIDVKTREIITPESMQGEMLVPIQGDASIAGGLLDNVEGVPLDAVIPLQGGPNYPLINAYSNNLLGWASMKDAAQAKQNQLTRAGLSGDQVRGVFARMGDEAMMFNTMVTEAMLRQLPALDIPKTQIKKFNARIRKSVPNFAGVETADGLAQLKGQLPTQNKKGKAVKPSNLRKLVVGEMRKKEFGNKGFPDYEDTIRALTEPELRGEVRGASGFSTIRAIPGADLISDAAHDTYSHGIPGIYAGGLERSVPIEVMFPDLYEATAKSRVTAKGKRQGQPLNEQERVGSVLMGGGAQKADQKWLDGVMNYLEKVKKGAVATGGLLAAEGAAAADVAADAASAIASPFLTSAATIQGAVANQPTGSLDAMYQQGNNLFDYQPRTELGQLRSQQAQQAMANALRGPLAAASAVTEPIHPILSAAAQAAEKLPRRAQVVGRSLLDLL